MAFWGVEVKPGKPFTHEHDDSKGRLHISMATLGFGSATVRSTLQCNVGNRSPVYLCSLFPGTTESLQLNLELEEVEKVTLSVIGPRSIHLCGYYLRRSSTLSNANISDYSESYGEDIANTETDRSNHSDEDEYGGSFIDDEGDPKCFSPSPVSDEEEAFHDKRTKGRKSSLRRLRRKYQSVESDDGEDLENTIVNGRMDDQTKETDNEDSLPISSIFKNKASQRILDEHMDDSGDQGAGGAGIKSDENEHRGNSNLVNLPQRNEHNKQPSVNEDVEIADNVVLPAAEKDSENRRTKKRKKEHVTKGSQVEGDNGYHEDIAEDDKANRSVENGAHDFTDGNQNERKFKKRKKKSKSQGNIEVNSELRLSAEQSNGMEMEDVNKRANAKHLQVRTLSNGLVIQELEMGKKDGKVAAPGRKISIHYTGMLKETGEVFESNSGQAPFKFRLGKGEVIEGWDVGLEGMQVGEKRRLVIPPSMTFQNEEYPEKVPPNSWLVYDFELVKVH